MISFEPIARLRRKLSGTLGCSFLIILLTGIVPLQAQQSGKLPMITMTTSLGEIKIEMYPDEAPVTVANFLEYVESGFFDGTIFHRVIPGFVVQGGGFTPDMKQKSTRAPIINEADNGLKNDKGTLSMARTQDPESATSQFFINLTDNEFLNFKSKSAQGWGYAVFARVVEGMDVVEKMAEVQTGQSGMHSDVPVTPIVVEKAEVMAAE